MKKNLALSMIAALALAGATPTTAQSGTDPGNRDTLWVDSVTAYASGIGVVPVTFYNDETLSTIEVTLQHASAAVRIDSFSFTGSRVLLTNASNVAMVNSDSTIITILSALTNNLLAPGRGLLGKLYYSYSNSITPQEVEIDTVTWIVSPVQHSTSFRPSGASPSPFIPHFVKGALDIQATPETFDSVWVADIEGAPGQQVIVEVGAYNERSLSKLALALDYGSDLLQLDSVSFVGTRGAAAPSKSVLPQADNKLYVLLNYGESVTLPTGVGPVANLFFTIDPTTPDEYIEIDSTTVGIVSNTRFTLTAVDGSEVIIPIFRAGGIDVVGTTDVEDITDNDLLPHEYAVTQNYPNPFNPTTQFELSLPTGGRVQVDVFNVLGQLVRTLVDQDLPAGVHLITFDGLNSSGGMVASGVYFYRVSSGDFTATKKMMLLK